MPPPPKPLTSMTIQEVLQFQRGPMRAATKGHRGVKDVGSTGVGAYQFESRTLAENAKATFGEAWLSVPFTPKNQDRIAETLYNRVRGDRASLANTWFVFKNGGSTQELQTATAPVPKLKASDFYLAKDDAIGSDLAIALRDRREIERIANIYQQNGMIEQFLPLRFKLMETDSNLLYLQGMQGIQELSALRDPRRLEAVYSAYLGSPVQFQPRSDGTYNVIANGQAVQSGVSAPELISAVRTGIDKQYLADRSKLSAEIDKMTTESNLRMREEAAKSVQTFTAKIYELMINGETEKAKAAAENAGGKLTNVDGVPYLQKDGELYKVLPGGEQIPGAKEGVLAAPSVIRVNTSSGSGG